MCVCVCVCVCACVRACVHVGTSVSLVGDAVPADARLVVEMFTPYDMWSDWQTGARRHDNCRYI